MLGKAQDRGLTEVAVEDYNLTGGREVARPQASDQEVGAHALHSALLPCVATDCDKERGSPPQGDQAREGALSRWGKKPGPFFRVR